jgi:polyhydroxybutyrate depolymerase
MNSGYRALVSTVSTSLLVLGLWGCEVSPTSSNEQTGGTTTSSGGSSDTGGSAGASSSSGGSASGGTTSTGGREESGGTTSSGGRGGSGGNSSTTSSGSETGGSSETGGDTGAGGQAGSEGGSSGGGSTGGDGGRTLPTRTGGAGSGGSTGTGAGAGGESGTGGGGGTTAVGGGGGSSEGCGSANTTSPCSKSGTTCSLTVNNKERVYYVQLPSGYSSSKPAPVVFQFHPWGGSAEGSLTMYSMSKNFTEAILISPQGLPSGGSSPGWANSNGEDIAFTKAMLADVEGKYCVDKARIFSTGFSYGGMMSFAIACEMSDVFRAIGPMAGSLYSDVGCKGSGPPIAMFGTHGTSDSVVPIADGRAARDKVLKQNHCGTDTKPVDPSPCVEYQGCDEGYPTIWCEWNGDHGMPSFGNASIAAFFKKF